VVDRIVMKIVEQNTILIPGLFGLNHSNRDFSQKEAWGKNCFNSSFPAALCAYLYQSKLDNIYLKLDSNLQVIHSKIDTSTLYGIEPTSDNLFYAFENQFTPYQQYVIGNLPGVDLVTQSRDLGTCLQAIEIKLTALPDQTTCDLTEDHYGCELVIRHGTIIYLACSIIDGFKGKLDVLKSVLDLYPLSISDWTKPDIIIPHIPNMIEALDAIALSLLDNQKPLLMQPVWKTLGKSPKLAENCLDVFVWSDLAFTRLFIDSVKSKTNKNTTKKEINRCERTLIWLFRMMSEFSDKGMFDHQKIFGHLLSDARDDKAFSITGKNTHKYMKSLSLTHPRICQSEIKNIILGGGQNLLSPERRFDAVLYNSSDLFD
jgi:HindVP restriction endonuclease